MLSTCNDKSSFAYWKLLLKVCSKHMTVEQKSHLSWGLWTYDFQQPKLNKPHICQRFHHIETNKLIYKVIWSAGFYTKIPWKKKQIKFISVKSPCITECSWAFGVGQFFYEQCLLFCIFFC